MSLLAVLMLPASADTARNRQNSAQSTGAGVEASRSLTLWYEQPAIAWMTEALPIGNGPMGAMLFGATDIERVQFNEITLWSGVRMAHDDYQGEDGTEKYDMGAYQAFGDILIHL